MKKTNGKTLEMWEVEKVEIEGTLFCDPNESSSLMRALTEMFDPNKYADNTMSLTKVDDGVKVHIVSKKSLHSFHCQFTRTGSTREVVFKDIKTAYGILLVSTSTRTETYKYPLEIKIDSSEISNHRYIQNIYTQVLSSDIYSTLKSCNIDLWSVLYGKISSGYLVDITELPLGGNLDGPKDIKVSSAKSEKPNEPETQSKEDPKPKTEESTKTEDDAETTEAVEVEVSAEASDDEKTKSDNPYLDMTSEDFNPFRITNDNLGEFLETNRDIFNKLGGKDETDIKESLTTSFSDPAARIIMVMTLDGIAKLVRAGDLSKESVDAMLASFDNIGEGLSEMSQTNDKSNDKKKKVKVTMR